MPNDNDFDGLLDDKPGDRFDHHMERLEGRDLFDIGARIAMRDLERERRERGEAAETVAIVADGLRVLRTRDGVPLTDDMIMERARNIAMGLTGLPLEGVRFGARRAREAVEAVGAQIDWNAKEIG
jgi:hypothetical protein